MAGQTAYIPPYFFFFSCRARLSKLERANHCFGGTHSLLSCRLAGWSRRRVQFTDPSVNGGSRAEMRHRQLQSGHGSLAKRSWWVLLFDTSVKITTVGQAVTMGNRSYTAYRVEGVRLEICLRKGQSVAEVRVNFDVSAERSLYRRFWGRVARTRRFVVELVGFAAEIMVVNLSFVIFPGLRN